MLKADVVRVASVYLAVSAELQKSPGQQRLAEVKARLAMAKTVDGPDAQRS
jgi:hypothetical protein